MRNAMRRLPEIRRLAGRAVIGGVAMILFTLGCASGGPEEAAAQRQVQQGINVDSLCAHEIGATPTARMREALMHDCVRRFEVRRRLRSEMTRLADLVLNIPEYQDEQRFVVAPDRFGPMVNVFASPFIGQFTAPWQIEAHGASGVLAAIVYVDTIVNATLEPPYTDLHLRPGMNCLWIAYSAGTWAGFISQTPPNAPCDRNASMSPLQVNRSRDPGFGAHADYPAVARIGEARDGRPVLGVKCLDGWCELGPTGFVPAAPRASLNTREARIHGWHDEQRLARIDVGGVVRPTGLHASVIPERDIESRPESYFVDTWRRVAIIELHGSPDGTKYANWGLRQGRNMLELRRTTAGAWQARATASGGTPVQWANVGRHPHVDAAVPGTARWRFTSYDDGVWIPCGQACCRADNEM